MLNHLRLLLLGIWLGAAVFFSAAVAPSAFAVLRGYQITNASEIAGAIVNRNLAVINFSGFILGLVLLVTGSLKFHGASRATLLVEMICHAVLTLGTGVGKWVIAAKLQALRLTLSGPIENLSMDDPRRQAFDQLHGYSVKALSVAIIAAFVGFILIAIRARGSIR